MKWWVTLLTRHELSRSLIHATIGILVVMSMVFIPLPIRLLVVFGAGAVIFAFSIVLYTRILLQFRKIDTMPNYGTYGYWVTSVTGFVFSMMIVIPSFFALHKVAQAPITIWSYLFVFSAFYHFWTLFLVAHRGYKIMNSSKATAVRKEKGDML